MNLNCTKVLIDKYYQTKEIFQKLSCYNMRVTGVEAVCCNVCAEQELDDYIGGKVSVMLERPVLCIWMHLAFGFHVCYPQMLP